MKGLSLFSSAGIGETYLNDLDMEIVTANELIPQRAELYKKIYGDNVRSQLYYDTKNEMVFELRKLQEKYINLFKSLSL